MNKIVLELKFAEQSWSNISESALATLKNLITEHRLSVRNGDITRIDRGWYVTHAGLLRLARRERCAGINVRPLRGLCNPSLSQWFFVATAYRTRCSRGFTGYGDANPSNISPLMSGAEMRVAETRAVNRALRKAYGIGICSAEEIGGIETRATSEHPVRKLPPQSSNGKNGHAGNGNSSRVRDRLCQLIRQHNLDAELVKAYAVDFCGTKTLREASREQVENFVTYLADWAAKDRNALLCQLNSYAPQKEGAA